MIEMVPISDGASPQMNNPFHTASLCCDMNTGICSVFLKFVCVYMLSLSHVRLSATLWTVACQAPLSMGFSRQEHWSVADSCCGLTEKQQNSVKQLSFN